MIRAYSIPAVVLAFVLPAIACLAGCGPSRSQFQDLESDLQKLRRDVYQIHLDMHGEDLKLAQAVDILSDRSNAVRQDLLGISREFKDFKDSHDKRRPPALRDGDLGIVPAKGMKR